MAVAISILLNYFSELRKQWLKHKPFSVLHYVNNCFFHSIPQIRDLWLKCSVVVLCTAINSVLLKVSHVGSLWFLQLVKGCFKKPVHRTQRISYCKVWTGTNGVSFTECSSFVTNVSMCFTSIWSSWRRRWERLESQLRFCIQRWKL